MDWLKDKKNQPIVAAILAVVIVGAGVLLWMNLSGGSAPTEETTSSEAPAEAPAATSPQPTPPAPSMPTAATPTAPTTPAPTPSGQQVAEAKPMETWRADPFLPIGYKPPKAVKPKPRIWDFPFIHLPPPKKQPKPEMLPEEPQPVRRLAGVMLNSRVFAIIESGGKSKVYQPGEPLEDGLAVVERIEADKVILKTLRPPYRYLTVRLASSGRARSGGETAPPPGGSYGPPSGGGPMFAPSGMP